MTTPTPDPLALAEEAETLANAATPGPWYVEQNEDVWQLFAANGENHPWQLAKCPKRRTPYAEYWPGDSDAALIARARDLVPALASALRAALGGTTPPLDETGGKA